VSLNSITKPVLDLFAKTEQRSDCSRAHLPFSLPFPLHRLSYFGASPFYDKQSSNEILKMQRMHTGVEHEEGDQEEDLK